MKAHLKSAWINFSVLFVCSVTPAVIMNRDEPLWILVACTAAIYVVGTAIALGVAVARYRRVRGIEI